MLICLAVIIVTRQELQKLSKPLADIYTQLETDLINNIAEYLKTQNIDSATAQWKIKALANLGKLDKVNIKTIAKYADVAPEMLELVLEQSALTAIEELEPGFKKLAKKGILKGADVPIEKSVANTLKAFSKQATEQLNLVNTVMKYKSRSACSKIIKDTAELANKQEFLNTLNKATGKAVTGIEARQQAMRQAINEMANKGIPCFTDKLGREWSPEAYINMDIRTTCGNVAHQSQFNRMDEYDIDLIEISSHVGARPKCAKDQGKIFDRKNKSKKYRHWKNSSYGEPDGILGINCGHHAYPYIPGVSQQTYFPTEDMKENDRLYKLSQQQRQLERNVRKTKNECACLDTLGDKEGFKKASIRLKREQSKLKNFCNSKGRTYHSDRTFTPNYNKTISAKAVSNQKYYTQAKKLIGVKTSTGVTITDVSSHIVDRISERSLSIDDMTKALTKPLKTGNIKADKSQQFIGENATVAINTKSGNAITAWKTKTKIANKLKEGYLND